MAPKNLGELLAEDQEQFFLDASIYDRQHQLKRPSWPLIHRKSISFTESFFSSCFSSSSFQYDVARSLVPLPPKFSTDAMNDTFLEPAQGIGDCGPKGCDLLDGKKQGNSAAWTGTVELLFRTLTKLGRRSWKWNTDKIQNSHGRNRSCSTSESSDAPSGSERREGRESLNVVGKSSLSCPESWSAAGSPSHYELKDKDDAVEVRADEKEQLSPVSVIDPPSFDDDTEEHDYDVYGYRLEYVDDFDHETSPSRIGTSHMLLRNLYLFQRQLLGFDLFALEERPVEPDGGTDQDVRKMRVTKGMMKMVSDLIVGEQETKESIIEMGWRRNHILEDIAEEIELAILGVLVEELSDRI